jgi:hypothetical protein
MYTVTNFKSGKALKEAFKAGERLETWQPGGMFAAKRDGDAVIEGPHYPKPHSFYVQVRLQNGIIVAVKNGSKWITQEAK